MSFTTELETLLSTEGVTQEQVQKLIGKHFVPKGEYNSKVQEVNTLSSNLEEIQNKSLTVEQQLQAKLDKAIKDAESTQKNFVLKSNNLEVEKLFTKAGISQEDYQDLLGTIVSEDLDKSVATANTFISILEKKVSATKEQTKQDLLDTTPEPSLGDLPKDPTAGFMKIKDDEGNEFDLGNLPFDY